ncbi:hypothetical protein N7520_011765 [Penicillium odoratum]|uniref:uncharacterized protein n=1 Tax=Penicillium odoratum TaxID=1167516 RepID=UPI0025479BFF|nr:uncharacterized protein N7520_011765 [Penicillium odoratum]KAJ5746583.1 hypothetical protein N7520_011765 [Penicillium odoratum]
MNSPTHIIDPDGEVLLILRNADCPFAQPHENTITASATDVHPEMRDDIQSPAELTQASECYFENGLTSKQKRKERKKKKMIKTIRSGVKEPEPAVEEPAVEEPAVEEPTAEEPTAEEPAVEEPTAEEPAVEESAAEEPTVEEPAAEEPTVEEPAAEEPDAEEPAVKDNSPDFLDSSCFRIQVSAKHMMFASPVFKNILTGGWKESIDYMKEGSVEVTAESWNLEALLIVLRAIHGQHYDIPEKLTLEMLAQVAAIADYYKCKERLHILKGIWINNMKESVPTTFSRELILWLWIACFLPNSKKQLRLRCHRVMVGLIVGDSLCPTAQEALDSLVTLLHETRDAFIHGSRGCCYECRSIMYGALTMQMQSNNLLSPKPETPFPNLSYHSLVRRVLAFTSPQWCVSSRGYARYQSDHDCPDACFEFVFTMLKDSLEGLELRNFA